MEDAGQTRMPKWHCGEEKSRPKKDAKMAARRRKAPAKKEDAEMAARQRKTPAKQEDAEMAAQRRKTPAKQEDAKMAARRRKTPAKQEDELVQFMEHHLDEGMKEVLVYLELTLMSHHHDDQEKVLLRLKWIWLKAIPA
jgi:hypothetical protein